MCARGKAVSEFCWYEGKDSKNTVGTHVPRRTGTVIVDSDDSTAMRWRCVHQGHRWALEHCRSWLQSAAGTHLAEP